MASLQGRYRQGPPGILCCPTTPAHSSPHQRTPESHKESPPPDPQNHFTEVAAEAQRGYDLVRATQQVSGQVQNPTLCQPYGKAVSDRRKKLSEGAEGWEARGETRPGLRAGPSHGLSGQGVQG